MPNYAVVIGINAYRESSRFGPLSRPVGDAIRMMQWLLDPANAGGVAEEDLILLLGPNEDEGLGPILDDMDLPAERRESIGRRLGRLAALGNRREAGFEEINRALRDVHGRAGDRGDRLYVYYAGHGLSAATDALGNDVEDAIVPSDYDPSIPRLAISIPSITRTSLATSFREQFFFFDCCRNRLDREEIARVGRLSPRRGRVPTDQYIYSATALGLSALEGDGLFSDILLRGLDGEGAAKAFSPRSGTYEVLAERLFRYLRDGFEALSRGAFVGGEGVEVQPQRPRLGGDHGGDPVLKTLADAPAVGFRVDLETPPNVPAGSKVAEVRMFGEGLPPEPPREAMAGSPVAFSLAPRFYLVQIAPTPGLEAPPPAVREVYDDPTLHPAKLTPALFAMAGPDERREPIAAAAREASTRLTISADDPLAPIELLDSSGDPVRDRDGRPLVGVGRLEHRESVPGIYRARTRSPQGRIVEEVVAVESGGDVRVQIRPGVDGRSALRARGEVPVGIRLVVGGEVLVPEPGRLVDPDLTRRLSTPEGVAGYLDELEVRIRPMGGEPGEPVRMSRDGATARLERELAPGAYLLTVAEPSRRATTLATVVLDGRTTELVVHQGADGRVDVSLLMPPARGASMRDPEAIRAAGMLQRLVGDGDARLASAVGERLLGSSPLDPVVGLLVGLLRLREGRHHALADLADRMVDRFPALPDAHALLALLRIRAGDPTGARSAFGDALALGLPILAPLLLAASDAVASLGVDAPLLDDFADALVPALLWTARRPAPASALT